MEIQRKLKYVIADDDPDDHALIKEAFREAHGHCECDSVYNGKQLLDYLMRKDAYTHIETMPDFVILDWNMPIMNGEAALRKITENATLSVVPVYVLTTSTAERDKTSALGHGAKNFYVKPPFFEQLKAITREILTGFDHIT